MNRYEFAQAIGCDVWVVPDSFDDEPDGDVRFKVVDGFDVFPIKKIVLVIPPPSLDMGDENILSAVWLTENDEEHLVFKLLHVIEGCDRSSDILTISLNKESGTLSSDFEADFPIWCFLKLNHILLNSPQDIEVEEREYKRNTAKKKGKNKKKRNVVRTYKCFTIKKQDDSVLPRKINITCEAWGVRGHYRHYKKSGKTIFVNPYTKGPKRNEGAYETKEYKTSK